MKCICATICVPFRETFTNTLCGNIRLLDLHTHATVFYGENIHAMTNNNKLEIEVEHGTNCTFFVEYATHWNILSSTLRRSYHFLIMSIIIQAKSIGSNNF